MDHQLQQLFDFGLEAQGFFGGGHAFISRKNKHKPTGDRGESGRFQGLPP
jgi:hypothetical protein